MNQPRDQVGAQIRDGKYEVLCFGKKKVHTASKQLSISRTKTEAISRKIGIDKNLLRKYKETIHTYISRGYAKNISKDELTGASKKIWYLLHHAVFHQQKPGKVKIAFYASALFKGKNLNSELYTGPDLLDTLIGVLLRFRNHGSHVSPSESAESWHGFIAVSIHWTK